MLLQVKYLALFVTCHINVLVLASVCPYKYCPVTGTVVTVKSPVSTDIPSLLHWTFRSPMPDTVHVMLKLVSSKAGLHWMLTERGNSILAGAGWRKKSQMCAYIHCKILSYLSVSTKMSRLHTALSQSLTLHCHSHSYCSATHIALTHHLHCTVTVTHVALPQSVTLHCNSHSSCTVTVTHLALSQSLILHCHSHPSCTITVTHLALLQSLNLHCHSHSPCTVTATHLALSQSLTLHSQSHSSCTTTATHLALSQ